MVVGEHKIVFFNTNHNNIFIKYALIFSYKREKWLKNIFFWEKFGWTFMKQTEKFDWVYDTFQSINQFFVKVYVIFLENSAFCGLFNRVEVIFL